MSRELLFGLVTSIRYSLLVAWLVLVALAVIVHGTAREIWIYPLGCGFLALGYWNLWSIERLVSGPAGLDELWAGFLRNLRVQATCAVLLAAIVWFVGPGLSAYGELMLTLLLAGYCLLFAFIHSTFPWSVMVTALLTGVSLTAYWAHTRHDFKWPVAMLTLVFFALMMRAVFNFGSVMRRSLRLQIERDEARQRAENAARGLEDALAQLRRADTEKLRLFAAANHDLRQPISAISLFVGVLERKLRRKLGDDEEIDDLLDKLDRNIQALDVIVNSLSELTSLERGGLKVQPRSFELDAVVRDVVREFSAQSDRSRTPIEVRLPALAMFSDPAMLTRIIRNVLDNALKYAAGRQVEVSLSGDLPRWLASREGPMQMSIRDHGPGIPEAMRAHVFDEYIQVNNPARDRKKGYGLGLSIARRMADALGSNIELRSPEGGGLEFLLDLAPMISTRARLPSADAASEASPRIRYSTLDQDQPDPALTSPQSIVLVDDDDDVRAGLQALFETWGHRVRGFSTIRDTLNHLASLPGSAKPRHILVDNWLPDGRGIERVADFRALSPDSRLTLLTGDSDPRTVAHAAQVGMGVLIKPVTANTLAQLLRS